ncbi:hypothetical protein BTM25_33380 [Actinomadura rubteroloni]|uniref:Uncharacterized protein n=1 Tax=Actinomadura rubteroloni TaxID=1926885 RepID=A0A2P4UI25_9ACTN|nr:hypothetical protein [Actinomadura rubteroloni]POM24704.1 hypothetical protein BTM25_33380 [Actinomadura rubteroloni]
MPHETPHHKCRHAHVQGESDGLIETQGINAGPPIDAPPPPAAAPEPAEEPPEHPATAGDLYDERVGLPGQKPGYPGQQNSIETS